MWFYFRCFISFFLGGGGLVCFTAHHRLADATAKHCGTFLWAQMFKMKDVFLKKDVGMLGNHSENKKYIFLLVMWWWWWWWWCHMACTGGHLAASGWWTVLRLSLLLMSNEAAVLAWRDLRPEPTSSRLLTPPLVSSCTSKKSPPLLSRVVLYMLASFGCWFGFFLRWRRWRWRICFALASWMHIVVLLKPYSLLWDFEGFAHAAAWIWFLPPKCYSAQKSWKHTFSIGFDNDVNTEHFRSQPTNDFTPPLVWWYILR